MQTDVQNGLATLGIGLPNLPRLTLCDVAVADTSQIHGLELGITELKLVEQFFDFSFYIFKFLNCLTIYVEPLATGGNNTIPVFLGELEGTVDKIAIDGNQLVVITILEVFPSEIVVLGLRGIGCQHVAQHILLTRHINQILMQPDSPVA